MGEVAAGKPWDMKSRRLVVRPGDTDATARRVMPATGADRPPAFRPEELEIGGVYELDRDRGLTPTAVYTGESTGNGRLRFEIVDRQIGENRYVSVKPHAVMARVAASLAEWCRGQGKGEVGA
jgi:hypothetical protein